MNSTSREQARDHLGALEVMRIAKNAFFWLAIVGIVFHMMTWFLMQRRTPDDEAMSVWTEPDALQLAGFVVRSSVLVLAGIMIVTLLLSVTSKLGGAVGLAKACVWTLAALALVTPWVSLDMDAFARFNSMLPSFQEMEDAGSAENFWGKMRLSVRYLLCPLIVAGCLVVSQFQFRVAHRKMTIARPGKLPIHEV